MIPIAPPSLEEKISTLYEDFGVEAYSELALNPDSYPFSSVVSSALQKYEINQAEKSVLDLGCGPGLLKEFTSFASYAGLDLSEEMLQAAAKRGYNELIQSTVQDYLPLLPDNSYDCVICFSVTYFIDPLTAHEVLRHIDRVAKNFWLISFDGIPDDLIDLYKKEYEIDLYNHIGIGGVEMSERFMVPGWKSVIDDTKIPMEIGVRKK